MTRCPSALSERMLCPVALSIGLTFAVPAATSAQAFTSPACDGVQMFDAEAGELFELDVSISYGSLSGDLPAGAFTVPPLPAGDVFDPETPVSVTFRWTPGYFQAGVHPVTFTAAFSGFILNEVDCDILIDVEPPWFSSPSCGTTYQAVVGEPLEFEIETIGDLSGDLPPGATTSPSLPTNGGESGTHATFRWTPAPSQVGIHQVDFSACTTLGQIQIYECDPCSVFVDVDPAPVNTPPVFDFPACPSTVEAAVGEELAVPIRASDADPLETLVLVSSQFPAGGAFSPPLPRIGDPVTTTFRWTPGSEDVGLHSLRLSADDGDAQTSCNVTIAVAGEDPPVLADPPIPIGPTFRLSGVGGGEPAVAHSLHGREVVVWSEDDGSAILGRNLDPTGAPIGQPFTIALAPPGGTVEAPSATFAGQNLFVAWLSRGPGAGTGEVRAQVVGPGGPTGGPVTLSSPAQPAAAPTTRSAGTSNCGPASTLWGGYFGSIDLCSATPVPPAPIADPEEQPRDPSADVNPTGQQIQVWVGTTGGGTQIRAQRRRPDGSPIGASFTVSDRPPQQPDNPAVSIATDGSFTVTWDQLELFGSDRDVFARRYGADGASHGPPFPVGTDQQGDQRNPGAESNGSGDTVIVYEDEDGTLGGQVIDAQGNASGDLEIETDDPGAGRPVLPSVVLSDDDELVVSWGLHGPGGIPRGVEVRTFRAANLATTCAPGPDALCLNDGRFRVTSSFSTSDGSVGTGNPAVLTSDTGYFWFFDEANVEVVLKVLDARGINGRYWIFYGSLSDVEYALTVTDLRQGVAKTYLNSQGTLASVADTQGILDEAPRGAAPISPAGAPTRDSSLELDGGRFVVEVDWTDFLGTTGTGTAVALTQDTGYFWFFDEANVELVVKVLDGRPLNGFYWVFYGALSNVRYTVRVTDTFTGAVKVYQNPSGNLASVADTAALPGN